MSTNQTYKDLFDKALSNDEINALAALQVGEISAVQAYDQALDRVKNMELVPTLEECRESHAQRAAMLRVRLRELGANPLKDGGLLGGLASIVESAACTLGDQRGIEVLAKGESIGTEKYESYMGALDAESWHLVKEELWPLQKRTEQMMSLLCNVHEGDMKKSA
ncbi:MAG: ferritin-like domain-containing protein [Bdellovibrionales bacterium]|nr:ferritin-like domain-containing protein [Bdellovibrionales bacterium]